MPPLTPPPKIKLSRLRDIGWRHWDPIGLMRAGKSWEDEECLPFANEYDNYLMIAAGQLRRGASDAEVVNFLVEIEVEDLGLEASQDCRKRAQKVVAAIRADKLLWVFPKEG